jgi:uncharacterized protein (TIGR00369 family)
MSTAPTDAAPANGTELMEQFMRVSPFAQHLAVELVEIENDRAVVRLPFSERLVTYGDIVHGGALAALGDIATMASAWAGADLPEKLRGVTVTLSLQFVDTARAEDVTATGRVVRRGRTLSHCDVEMTGADGRVIAKAIGTYKVG